MIYKYILIGTIITLYSCSNRSTEKETYVERWAMYNRNNDSIVYNDTISSLDTVNILNTKISKNTLELLLSKDSINFVFGLRIERIKRKEIVFDNKLILFTKFIGLDTSNYIAKTYLFSSPTGVVYFSSGHNQFVIIDQVRLHANSKEKQINYKALLLKLLSDTSLFRNRSNNVPSPPAGTDLQSFQINR